MSEIVPEASADPSPVPAPEKKEDKGSAVWREIKGLLWVLVAVLLFHSFVAKPFYIPSESMMPSLLKGDRLVVSKFPYGWSWVSPSFHILPRMEGRLFGSLPERGDIVIVTPPGQSADYIKRVIGLPGDTIGYHDNVVSVNGEPFGYRVLGRYVGEGQGREMSGATLSVEELPGRPHPILERDGPRFFSPQGEGEWVVPPGHYFVMGDNRDNSEDSRYWGFLPESNLRGKAFLVWMHWDGSAGGVDFDRIGSSIP